MYDLIFTSSKNGTEQTIKIGTVKTEEEADKKMTDSFVRFCRDVAHKPLEREHYANGFSWIFNGVTYSLHYRKQEETDGDSAQDS